MDPQFSIYGLFLLPDFTDMVTDDHGSDSELLRVVEPIKMCELALQNVFTTLSADVYRFYVFELRNFSSRMV